LLPTLFGLIASVALLALTSAGAFASELDLQLPTLDGSQRQMLFIGLGVCVVGMLFGVWMFNQVKAMPAHQSMLDVSTIIYETCKTYLLQQGRLLIVLEAFIAACIIYYFGVLQHLDAMRVITILAFSVVGILGSYGVAWFGIRMNTLANSRTAFASLRGKPLQVYEIPLQAGMSIGVLLICVELIMMLAILLFVSPENAGACFLGFAIGESLGASALRIAGGIFTKIADIGSDLMKVVFKIKEDDPRNPGVIADCTGDNAGDSVGPTADGFETYGVTGVALISFIALAVMPEHKAAFLVWIFVMRILMILTSMSSYLVNAAVSRAQNTGKDKINFEQPLTNLVWITSCSRSWSPTRRPSGCCPKPRSGTACGGSSRPSSRAARWLPPSFRSSPRSSPARTRATSLKSWPPRKRAARRSPFCPEWWPATSRCSGRPSRSRSCC
jgi:K(+)-stimulated pyrophosphate-energized sodium pump